MRTITEISYVEGSMRIVDAYGGLAILAIFEVVMNGVTHYLYSIIPSVDYLSIGKIQKYQYSTLLHKSEDITLEYIENFTYHDLQEKIKKYLKEYIVKNHKKFL